MKSILISGAAGAMLAAFSIAQTPSYILTDLGPVGGGYGGVGGINKHDFVGGTVMFADNTSHATAWYKGWQADLSKPGLGGQNSVVFGINASGVVAGIAETSKVDPHNEDFCGFKALGLSTQGSTCVPMLWQDGVMTQLETLGGNNGYTNSVNNRGEAAGIAETTAPDPTCPPPNVFQFKPVIWRIGGIQQLPTFPGDPAGEVLSINDAGQAVGASGDCGAFSPQYQVPFHPNHALFWENGVATDIGNLGGGDQGMGTIALNINQLGQVAGSAATSGGVGTHAFLWSKSAGTKDLGTLPGDVASAGLNINDNTEVVGLSLDPDFNPTAFHWQNGVMTNLNSAIPADSPFYLLLALSINGNGDIAGLAVDTSTGIPHAFMLTPQPAIFDGENPSPEKRVVTRPVLSAEVRSAIQRIGRGRFALPAPASR